MSHIAAPASSETLVRSTPRHARARRTHRGQQPWFATWKAPLLLIAVQVAVLGYLIRGSFFYADDYQAFGLAHTEGLSTQLLFHQGYGNLAPTERLLHWIPLSIAPMNYGLGEAIILLLTASLLVSLLWALRELRANPTVIFTAIFIVGSSTIVLYEVFDYDQVVYLFPTQACIMCVIALFTRWIRTGRSAALVACWIVFVLSFFTQERVLLVPVYLVILRYLVLPYRLPPGGRRKPWADWRIWIPFGAIDLAYYAYYRTVAQRSHPHYSTTITFYRMAFEGFLRALFGLPLQGAPRWVTPVEWLAVLILLVAILAASRMERRRKALLGATAYFLVAFGVNLFAVFQGIGGALGITGIVSQHQYYLDSLLALALAVGMATSPLVSASEPQKGQPLIEDSKPAAVSLRSPLVLACAVVVAFHLALLPFGMSNVLDTQGGQRTAASWVPTVRSSLAAADQAKVPTTVVPLTMPAAFVPGFEAPFQLEQPFLALLPEWRDSNVGPVDIIGPTGSLLQAHALNSVALTGPQIGHFLGQSYLLSMHTDSNGDACFTSRVGGGQFRLTLPQGVSGDQLAVDIHLATSHPLTMTPFVVGPSQTTVNEWPDTVPAGQHRLVVAFQNTPANIVGFTGLNAGADFCVLGIQVGALGVQASLHTNQCQKVNQYGWPVGTREPCGVQWW